MTHFVQTLISGLSLGSIYALIALGYTMVYGIAKMLNFAHGDIIMVGAYAAVVAVFSIGQMAIFAVTGMEQTQLIESTFAVIGLECGGLLVKRILEKVLPGKEE